MQLAINSANIGTLNVAVTFDIYNRTVLFDTSNTSYNGSGQSLVQGISFLLEDQDGVRLAAIDFSDTANYIVPSVTETKTIDLSSLPYQFLFQTYKISASIKDQDDTIYTIPQVYKKVCQPNGLTDSGYVPGIFQVAANCADNVLTVKELTALVYNNLTPYSTSKEGILSYPTGTIDAIEFEGTPFTNDVIYTGQYRVNCETVSVYDLGDEVYVAVTYLTNNVFSVTCANKIGDLMCCLVDLQQTALRNCSNAVGQNAKQKMQEVLPLLVVGIGMEINGQDASKEAAEIRKMLNCDCGVKSITQNEFTPINPAVTNIVLTGVGGTTIPSPSTVGNTKTYNIASNAYQVVKGNTGDLAWSITPDTSTQYVVKYKITFDYNVMAGYILTAFENSPTYIQRLNDLITSSGLSLQGLDGKCVIDLTQADYVISQSGLSGSTTITNIVINGNTYIAPGTLFATNTVGIQNWLNSLTLGTFSVVYNSGTLTIISNNNSNTVSTLTIGTPTLTIQFQSTNATLVEVLQAIIDYLCGLTTLQVALNAQLSLCLFDYNDAPISYTYNAGQPQSDFNLGISQAVCNIVARINSLTGVTCAKLVAIFQDSPSAVVGADDRFYANVGGVCVGLSYRQVAVAVYAATNAFSDVKAMFCAIDCTVPGTCPDISNISVAMSGSNVGFYGLTWANTPIATQTVTVRYKLQSSGSYVIATNSLQILPNGNISGTSPFEISGVTPGQTYNVFVQNNCGGAGFGTTITIPTETIFSGDFLLDTVIYNICGNEPITLYSNSPFGSGVIMYSDVGLTTPVTGYTFIANASGAIYAINPSTGVVGAATGTVCDSGTAGSYILGNDTGTICSGESETLYTNGPFAIGGTLYSDSALTTPVTGFSYVVNNGNNHIYNLNSGTGAIGSDTSLACNSAIVNWSFAVLGATSGSIQISENAINFVNTNVDDSGTNNVSGGSTIQATVDATPALDINYLKVEDVTASTTLYESTSSTSARIFSWTAIAGHTYQVTGNVEAP